MTKNKSKKKKNLGTLPGKKSNAKSAGKIPQMITNAIKLQNQGDLVGAEAIYQQVLQIDPQNFDALNMLGMIAGNVGMNEVAIELINAAIAVNPNIGSAYGNLANIHKQMGEHDSAKELYQKALQLDASDFDAVINLGSLYIVMGDYPNALVYLKQAVEMRPDSYEAHSNLGAAYLMRNRLDEAANHLEKSLSLNPNAPNTYSALAKVFRQRMMTEEARHCYEAGISVNPESAFLHEGLGSLYLQMGDKEGARASYSRVLELDPNSDNGLMGLVTANDPSITDEMIEQYAAKLDTGELSEQNQRGYCFSIGRYYDLHKQSEKAFTYFKRGNELKHAVYNRQETESFVDELCNFFSEEFFASHHDYGMETDKPMFIVGMPRSGTTLVETILSSHTDVFGAGESDEIGHMTALMPLVLGVEERFPRCLEHLSKEKSQAFAGLYMRYLEGFGVAAQRITEKLPNNFLYLGFIALLFPNTRIVYCKRNPINVGISNYFQDFAGELTWSYDLEDFVHFYRQHERIMEHWHKVLPVEIFDVQYEELVEEQERISRELLDYCNLEWTDECLNFHKSKRVVATASLAQVRQPIYKSSVQRWKRYGENVRPLLDGFPEWAQ
jgi:tetratricopeptide (TPR) repeat protein